MVNPCGYGWLQKIGNFYLSRRKIIAISLLSGSVETKKYRNFQLDFNSLQNLKAQFQRATADTSKYIAEMNVDGNLENFSNILVRSSEQGDRIIGNEIEFEVDLLDTVRIYRFQFCMKIRFSQKFLNYDAILAIKISTFSLILTPKR